MYPSTHNMQYLQDSTTTRTNQLLKSSNNHLKHHAYQFSTTESKNQPINHKFNNKLAAFQDHMMETNKQLVTLQDHAKKSLGNNQLQLIQIQHQL